MNMSKNNINTERNNVMNSQMLNILSGAIMSPMVKKLIKKISVSEVENVYNALECMYENEQIQEVFSLLHILIVTSGIKIPDEYNNIVSNCELREQFVCEAIADIEDILCDFEQ